MSFANKMTWLGLVLVGAGWVTFFGAALFGAPSGGFLGAYEGQTASQVFSLIGQTTILTGFGFSILGILARGVFAVETLAGEMAIARAKPQAVPTSVESHALPIQVTPAAVKPPTIAPPKKAPDIVSRGEISGREYVLFADGSVGVETLLGRRRFRTMGDAREFIGP